MLSRSIVTANSFLVFFCFAAAGCVTNPGPSPDGGTSSSQVLIAGFTGAGSGSVTSADGEINCSSSQLSTGCAGEYGAASVVKLTASPAAGSTFSGWSGACSGTSLSCTVTVGQSATVIAQFDPIVFSLRAVLSGTGQGTVVSQPSGISCSNGPSPATSCSGNFDQGAQVTLYAQALPGSSFTQWSGGGCSGSGLTCTTTVSAASSITAQFDLVQEPLTVVSFGSGTGSVASSTGTLSCSSNLCTGSYGYGASVQLTASAASGSHFAGWTGACASAGTSPSCTVAMSQAQTAVAQFNINDYALEVALSGTGIGTVTSAPGGINCGSGNSQCTVDFSVGDSVTLTAAAGTSSTFTGWSGGGCPASGKTCTVPLTAATQVVARFDSSNQTLFVQPIGSGGTITVLSGNSTTGYNTQVLTCEAPSSATPATATVTCSQTLPTGTSLEIEFTVVFAGQAYVFQSYATTCAGPFGASAAGPHGFTMTLQSDCSITANFGP